MSSRQARLALEAWLAGWPWLARDLGNQKIQKSEANQTKSEI